ncbi:class I tRNA ligase family protein [Actinomadura rupiterrae]|uniref:class I tRNA ligase family protein n=1 Tax=Actinomadura rupiterrae TaxID=559627 RepID=UPI0020A2602E|nr:class I tRNA ligase family protein [Actinomadura rupiterrae]MCP2337459.1 methionyl-tRNA synthetase [Actinomadura rupiterrae]
MTTVITTPPPTPNGPLHVGHLSGPYVAGDIAARALRAAGADVLTMTGLDSNQNYVLAKAEALGRPVDEVMRDYSDQIRTAFVKARIEYDVLLDPAEDADYRDAMRRLVGELCSEAEETVLLRCPSCKRTMHHAYVAGLCGTCGAGAAGGACEACMAYNTGATLREARSTCCDAVPEEFTARVPVLRLEDYRDQLTRVWAEAELHPRVVDLVRRYLADGLPEIPVGYPTDWGIQLDGPDALRLDVWVEMAFGYLYVIARALAPSVRSLADCVAAWNQVDELWHFLGVDNAFYYTVLIPAVFAAAGVRPGVLRGLVVNEFYTLDGLKFSTSRNHAVWALDILDEEDPADVRLFLAQDRPDRYESDFTRDAFKTGRPSAEADLDRARHALTPSGFDPPLATRLLLPLRDDPRAQALLAAITAAPAADASGAGEAGAGAGAAGDGA